MEERTILEGASVANQLTIRYLVRPLAELRKQDILRLPTGCKSLDSLLSGGIEAGVITQIYGAPGRWKNATLSYFVYNVAFRLQGNLY